MGGVGPSAKALHQADEYATKLEEHQHEKEAAHAHEEAEVRQERERFNLEDVLAADRSSAHAGFGRNHPVERTRRRIFVKALLRGGRALELMGDFAGSVDALKTVLRVEPGNSEGKERLAVLTAPAETSEALPSTAEPSPPSREDLSTSSKLTSGSLMTGSLDIASPPPHTEQSDIGEVDDEAVDDASSVAMLLSSAGEYMRRGDYMSALQIYNFTRGKCRDLESPALELKVLTNTTLCLHNLKGRLPELVSACSEALKRVRQVKAKGSDDVKEEVLLHMECSLLSRRANAYAQQGMTEETDRDAEHLKGLTLQLIPSTDGKNQLNQME